MVLSVPNAIGDFGVTTGFYKWNLVFYMLNSSDAGFSIVSDYVMKFHMHNIEIIINLSCLDLLEQECDNYYQLLNYR